VMTVPGNKIAQHGAANISGAGLLIAAKAMKGQPVTVLVNDTHAVIELPDTVFCVELQDGQYPSWRQLMPDTFELEVRLPVAALADACKVAQKLCQRNQPVCLHADGVVKLHGETPDVGSFQEIFEDGSLGRDPRNKRAGAVNEIEVGVNPEFLAAAVSGYQTDTVVLRLISPRRPLLFEDGEDRYLVMPIRLDAS
jgi:DNA polymerase III subunit beta